MGARRFLVAGFLAAGALAGGALADRLDERDLDPVDFESVEPRELARRDPFVILVETPRPKPPPRPVEQKLEPPPAPPGPPPLSLEVAMVASVPGRQLALIRYKGQEYIVHPGWTGADVEGFDGRFRVKALETGLLVVEDRLLGTEAGFPF